MDINRELAELLGLCWHQMERIHPGGIFKRCYKCLKPESEGIKQPDFISSDGKIELLRLMKEMDGWGEFLLDNGAISKYGRHLDCIQIDLLTDTTGILAKSALEFLQKQGD
jgi:hypothetical protein